MATQLYQGDQGQVLNSRVAGKNEPAGIVVHSTRNYSQFRFSNANRPIDQRYLERLFEAVESKNLLDRYPILVTPGLLVIDGQHRLKVAEALHVPIYYIIADNMAVGDISKINDVNLKWRTSDYLHYWCEMGNEDYRQIAEFAKRYQDVSLSYIAYVCSMATTISVLKWGDVFREGKASAKGLERLGNVLATAIDFRPYLGKRWTNKVFLTAVNALLNTPGYSHETMMKRMEYQSKKLVPSLLTDDYTDLLTEIYNYRTQYENRLDFSANRHEQQQKGNRAKKERAKLT